MIKKCKSCQKQIDPKGIKCAHCGADQRNWFNRHTILVGIVIVVILGILGGIKYFSSANQEQVLQDQPTPTSVRHDNSGAGSSTDDNTNPIQEHMQRGLQHLGL